MVESQGCEKAVHDWEKQFVAQHTLVYLGMRKIIPRFALLWVMVRTWFSSRPGNGRALPVEGLFARRKLHDLDNSARPKSNDLGILAGKTVLPR